MKFHAEIRGSPTLYTATFILAMNKARYDTLPADLKKVIDQHSGQAAAQAAGQMWDDQAVVVADTLEERGNTITQIDKAEAGALAEGDAAGHRCLAEGIEERSSTATRCWRMRRRCSRNTRG